MADEKSKVQKAIESSWSDYCDLNYWIDEMARGSDSKQISKHVMKMAMKHLRDDFYDIHKVLCDIEEEKERSANEKTE
jgi:hypothetical protein